MNRLSYNQLKTFQTLTKSKGRKKHQLFLAEGDRCVIQMLQNQKTNPRAVIVKDGYDEFEQLSIEQNLIFLADSEQFLSLSDSVTPQNLIAIFEIPPAKALDFWDNISGNLIYLDRIQDPGNLGTIYRTAAWFGFSGIIMAKGTADLFQPKVVRSTAGATAAIPYFLDEDEEIIYHLQQNEWIWYVTTLDETSVPLNSVKFSTKSVLVIGNEGQGVVDYFLSEQFSKVYIPGSGDVVESLNAAVSAGIVMCKMGV